MANPRAERRRKAKDAVKNASDRADQAVEQINDNPQVIEAIEALRDEINAVEEFLNIEVE
jgi:hypothetical protein